MIITLTPNPSLDYLFTADRLVWEDANRIPTPRRRPGGQGINLVRAVRALDPDAAALAIAPLGGDTGREMRRALATEGVPLRAVDMDGETRIFVGARERQTGRSLLLNPRGPRAGPADERALLDAVDDALDGAGPGGGWLVACGSLLPGLPTDLYARVGARARERGLRFIPDCDGPALEAAVAAGCDLLVPNVHEAGRLLGREVDGTAGALAAARELLRRGPRLVVVTLGADGAVAASGRDVWHARPELPAGVVGALSEGSAVGAGDAFLAGLLLALDAEPDRPERALRRAVAAGTATLLSTGSDLVLRADAERLLAFIALDRPR